MRERKEASVTGDEQGAKRCAGYGAEEIAGNGKEARSSYFLQEKKKS